MHSKNILTVNEIPRKIKSHFIFLGFYIGTYREVDNISFADIIP